MGMWGMNLKLISSLMLGFFLGFGAGAGLKLAYEAITFKPYSWGDDQPVVVNCYGDDFSKSQFERASHYWTIRGHQIAFYVHDPGKDICQNVYVKGFIILRKGERFEHESGVLAHTKRWTSLAQMRGAVITYRPGTQNLKWINEHELGHALGYTHVEKDGHIMHPLHHKMEGKFWIP